VVVVKNLKLFLLFLAVLVSVTECAPSLLSLPSSEEDSDQEKSPLDLPGWHYYLISNDQWELRLYSLTKPSIVWAGYSKEGGERTSWIVLYTSYVNGEEKGFFEPITGSRPKVEEIPLPENPEIHFLKSGE
jgi:hypothetical protein